MLDPDFKICEQICPQFYYLHEFPWYDCNIYAIMSPDQKICLFDIGNGRSWDAICLALEMNEFNLNQITSIFITHNHFDHFLGLYRLLGQFQKENWTIPSIFAHPQTVKTLNQLDFIQTQLFPLNLTIDIFKTQALPIIAKSLQNGDIFNFGEWQWQIIYSPGHSSSSVSFFELNKKILISGDVIFADGGIGRTDQPFDSSLLELAESISIFANLPIKIILPGHGTPILENGSLNIQKSNYNIQKILQERSKLK